MAGMKGGKVGGRDPGRGEILKGKAVSVLASRRKKSRLSRGREIRKKRNASWKHPKKADLVHTSSEEKD